MFPGSRVEKNLPAVARSSGCVTEPTEDVFPRRQIRVIDAALQPEDFLEHRDNILLVAHGSLIIAATDISAICQNVSRPMENFSTLLR